MPLKQAAILTIGSELTDGLRLDTNSQKIAQMLTPYSYNVKELISIPDELDDVVTALKRLLQQYSLVITTGGLGPTHDDVTRDALSDVLGCPLVKAHNPIPRLDAYQSRVTDQKIKQELELERYIVDGATFLEPVGMAPGQLIKVHDETWLMVLPGPPNECIPMLQNALTHFEQTVVDQVDFSISGIGESEVQHRIERAYDSVASRAKHEISFTVLSNTGEVHAMFRDKANDRKQFAYFISMAKAELGEYLFSETGEDLNEKVIALAREHGISIATAESCTGGLVAGSLTAIPGSSEVCHGGIVTYTNEMKHKHLHVPWSILSEPGPGAVSHECAQAMAKGACIAMDVDLAISVTGIAGPSGELPDLPVGTVFIGLSYKDMVLSKQFFFNIDRDGVRKASVATALNMIRLAIEGHALENIGI